MARFAAGSIFARDYKIRRRLGGGAMGSVYEVEQLSTGRRMALKIMHPHLMHNPRAGHRFEREAKLGARIEHPHVVQTFDAGVDETTRTPWLTMEYLEGETLDAYVKTRHPLPQDTAATILEQLFSAIAAAHSKGVVHRDLKPENVFVLPDPERPERPFVKVLDFGIAKGTSLNNTGTEAGLGTPMWAAPEQGRQGYIPHPSADVWALGLIAFYVLTGHPYWRNAGNSGGMADLALEILRSEIVPASRRETENSGTKSKLTRAFDKFFLKAVSREPSYRYPNARNALEGLRRALNPISPWRWLWLSVAGGGVATVALLGYLLLDR